VPHESLKKVVECAFEDDHRSKNLIIFGLVGKARLLLEGNVNELFSELGRSPRQHFVELEQKKLETLHVAK
jgi:hypothetical protein